MAYVDVDKFAEAICDFQAIDDNAADEMIWFLRTFPTSDVVPKSEVAELLRLMFNDDCACNYNGNDEWLPKKKHAEGEE